MGIRILFIDSKPCTQPSKERISSHSAKDELLRDSKQLAQNHQPVNSVAQTVLFIIAFNFSLLLAMRFKVIIKGLKREGWREE